LYFSFPKIDLLKLLHNEYGVQITLRSGIYSVIAESFLRDSIALLLSYDCTDFIAGFLPQMYLKEISTEFYLLEVISQNLDRLHL